MRTKLLHFPISEVGHCCSMTINLRFIITLSLVWREASSSVVGVTYMDDFDFEQRYRKVHECDPFYWHPLHMPEDCADMYEKLIRNRLPTRIPKYSYIEKKRKKKPPAPTYEPYDYVEYPEYQEYEAEMEYVQPELTPYEKMLESVSKDVKNLPSVPSVQNMPNFGAVAVYQQPVSRISADMIKKVALTYGKPDDEEGKKRNRHRKGKGRWKQIVDRMRRRERQGWKKINNGDIVSFSKP